MTGTTGFKGSWLTMWLSEMGAKVTGFSLPPPTEPSMFRLVALDQSCDWIEGNVQDRGSLERAMLGVEPEVVFHLAAQPLVRESYLDPVGTYATNVMGTANLLDSVRRCPSVRAVVNVTTDKCYENKEWVWGYREDEPLGGFDPYSSSKGCSELVTSAFRKSFFPAHEYGKKHHVGLATARAGNVIGGGDFAKDRLVPDILRAIQASEKVKIRNPRAIRPWQHVLEPLSGYLLLAQSLCLDGAQNAEAWNFGPRDEDAKPVDWIVKTLCEMSPGSAGYEIESTPQPHEAHYLKLDISKASQRLGWHPRWDLKQALVHVKSWTDGFIAGADLRTLTKAQIANYQAGIG